MVDPLVPALREAASHRGYRLLVSKKRKPGVGDYGKFGLADAQGKPILGNGPDGLTASVAEIEAYLRGGELDTWKKSATLPAGKPRRAKARATPEAQTSPAHRSEKRHSPAAKATARTNRKTSVEPKGKPDAATRLAKPKAVRRHPEPPPLRIRAATSADAAALAALIAPRGNAAKQAEALAARMREIGKSGGILVAERGPVVGCLGWTLAPALHRPLSGRIATLLVAEKDRRRGTGRALVEEAGRLLEKAGCKSVEVMSDIDIRSAHGFFRRLDFAETSYRFAKPLGG